MKHRGLFFFFKFSVFFKRFYLFIFREGKGRREALKHQCVVASHVPHTGDLSPQSRHVPWLGIEPPTLWFTDPCSIHWVTTARATHSFFLNTKFIEVVLVNRVIQVSSVHGYITLWYVICMAISMWKDVQLHIAIREMQIRVYSYIIIY